MHFIRYKRLCSVLYTLGCLGTAQANEAQQFRFGLGLGFEHMNLEASIRQDFTPFGPVEFGNRKQTDKAFYFTPSFELGFHTVNNLYLGVLASWGYPNASTKSREPLRNLVFFIHRFKMTAVGNIFAKLGYKIAPKTMLYGLIGPSFTKWSHKTEMFDQDDIDSNIFRFDTFKSSKTSVGLGLGFGVEHFICEKIAFSIDYKHAFYKDVAKKQIGTLVESVGRLQLTQTGLLSKKISPSYDTITARLTYFF